MVRSGANAPRLEPWPPAQACLSAACRCVAAVSDHLEWNSPQKIGLADLHAAMAQDGVCRRAMEIDVGQHKVIEVVGALHLAFVGGSERERDFAIDPGIDLLWINGPDE